MSGPDRDLARALLDAARDETPPDESLERALSHVEATPGTAPPEVTEMPWLGWMLAAAAVALVGFFALRGIDSPAEPGAVRVDSPARVPDSGRMQAAPSLPAAVVSSARAHADPRPTPRTVGPSALTQPSAVAASKRTKPPPPRVGKGPCGCPKGDLMCHMRCSNKKKKKKKKPAPPPKP